MQKLLMSFVLNRALSHRLLATKITGDGKEIPKTKNFENRVTLIGTDNTVSITNLKNAESLSIRRDLKLVKIQDVDAKTRRPVYKLMTNAEYHQEEVENRKQKQIFRQNNALKGQKLLSLSSRIGEHDLMTGIKKMVKLLEKQYEVKVVIARESGEEERIFTVIEANMKSVGKIVQKRIKGNTLRFQLIPSKDNSSQGDSQGSSTLGGNNGDDKGPL